MQEQDIIELLLQRNEKGMDALLLHYGPLMRYIIAPILQNPQDQEDCLSEVAMRVWEKIEQFNQERGSWKTWLTAITRNAALNYTRDTHRHNSVEEIPDDAGWLYHQQLGQLHSSTKLAPISCNDSNGKTNDK